MKPITGFLIFVLIILCILYFTNPSKEAYADWVVEDLSFDSESVLEKAFVGLLGRPIVEGSTKVTDYAIYSLFETRIDGGYMATIGIFNHFILVEKYPKG